MRQSIRPLDRSLLGLAAGEVVGCALCASGEARRGWSFGTRSSFCLSAYGLRTHCADREPCQETMITHPHRRNRHYQFAIFCNPLENFSPGLAMCKFRRYD